jgi:hypothetical protein
VFNAVENNVEEIAMRNRAKMLIVLVLIGGLFAIGGCANLGPVFQKTEQIPDGTGLVYLYRPGGFVGGGVVYDVKVGDTVITTLPPGGYYPYFSQPGEVEFWAKTEARTAITIDVKPGETHYVKGTVGIGFFVGRPHLILVPPEVGEKEISDCKLIPEEKK